MQDKFNQSKYINGFVKQNYDRISVQVKKGERERIKALADSQNLSVNALILKALENYEKTVLQK